MQEAYAIAEQVALGDTTSVLIEGESGTGKEYFANLIHRMSARNDQPFVEINCAAIPSELLESELFGHEKGAFTDARTQKLGLMELASGGTLFLDEIGEMSPMLQVKLLRVLERRTFKRVGGTKDISVNLRVISATNGLEQMVRDTTFREDLSTDSRSCLCTCRRCASERDILPLSQCSWTLRTTVQEGLSHGVPGCRAELLDYRGRQHPRAEEPVRANRTARGGETLEPITSRSATARVARSRTLGQRGGRALASAIPSSGIPFENLVEELERALIVRASCATKWNQSRTADLLNLKRDKLRYRMKCTTSTRTATHPHHGIELTT